MPFAAPIRATRRTDVRLRVTLTARNRSFQTIFPIPPVSAQDTEGMLKLPETAKGKDAGRLSKKSADFVDLFSSAYIGTVESRSAESRKF